MDALNSTPGDTLYDTMYSKQDFQFIMEKKLESYKVMMMRSQSTLLYTSNNTSIGKRLFVVLILFPPLFALFLSPQSMATIY